MAWNSVIAAKHLCGDAAERIMPLLGRLEAEAGNAQFVHRELFARRQLACDVGEIERLAVGLDALGQPFAHLVLVQPRQREREAVRRLGGIEDDLRVGVERGGRQRDGQHLAVAVGDGGALGVHLEVVGGGRGEPQSRRRRRFGPPRLLDPVLLGRPDDRRVGELAGDGQEQAAEAGGGHQQAAARLLHRGARGEVGAGDAHRLRAWLIAPACSGGRIARRAEAVARAAGRGGVCHPPLPNGWNVGGATKVGVGSIRAMPSAETLAAVGSAGAARLNLPAPSSLPCVPP
jgi:hypothetical protein